MYVIFSMWKHSKSTEPDNECKRFPSSNKMPNTFAQKHTTPSAFATEPYRIWRENNSLKTFCRWRADAPCENWRWITFSHGSEGKTFAWTLYSIVVCKTLELIGKKKGQIWENKQHKQCHQRFRSSFFFVAQINQINIQKIIFNYNKVSA